MFKIGILKFMKIHEDIMEVHEEAIFPKSVTSFKFFLTKSVWEVLIGIIFYLLFKLVIFGCFDLTFGGILLILYNMSSKR